MWPGIIARQEAWLAPRENDRADGAKENKTTPSPKQWRVECISLHTLNTIIAGGDRFTLSHQFFSQKQSQHIL